MPPSFCTFGDDEEFSKKNDEYHRTPRASILSPSMAIAGWQSWKLRRRRIVLAFIAALMLYLFFRNMPYLGPVNERINKEIQWQKSQSSTPLPDIGGPSGAPPGSETREGHYYNGPIKWYNLAATLQASSRTNGFKSKNKNVLFAAASLRSLTRLIPVACEMTRWNRNVVHMVLMGRDDLTINEIKELNGVDSKCNILWHDARPDYSQYSTDLRFETSVFASLAHIQRYLNPQVYIIDEPTEEAPPFVKSIQSHCHNNGKTIIPLPASTVPNLLWLTRLDIGSLSAWHNTYVDILIHAPPESAGSLIRLLRSIEQADYFGVRYPHLTIELPPDVDPNVERFLENFIWPPLDPKGGAHTSQLTLRRRIPTERLTPEEASIRMIESFYPSRAHDSHVLLLSPQVQLSSLYYHYLYYNLLEYRYSSYSSGTREQNALMGISLALPAFLMDNATPLIPPQELTKSDSSDLASQVTPFLWQAPDTHATLYFGDKWRELHSFLSHRTMSPLPAKAKVLASNLPAFAEHFLELMRIRGYYIHYPHVYEYAFATFHNELYQPPEEFTKPISEKPVSTSNLNPEEPLIYSPPPKPPSQQEDALATTPLHALLPKSGDLPELSSIPLLDYKGKTIDLASLLKGARLYANEFRTTVGNCFGGLEPIIYHLSAQDLFCQTGVKSNGNPTFPDAGVRDALPDPSGQSIRFTQWLRHQKPNDEQEAMVPEAKRKQMKNEFEKHLMRQNMQNAAVEHGTK